MLCILCILSDHFPVGLSWKTKYSQTTNYNCHNEILYHNFANVDFDDLSSCISKRLSLKQFEDIDINAQVNALESVIKKNWTDKCLL